MTAQELTPRTLRTLIAKGARGPAIARRYGLSNEGVHARVLELGLTRFEAPGVLLTEIAARYGLRRNGVARTARALGLHPREWRGALMVSRHEAAVLEAHYAQQHPAADYAHYLSGEQVAARLGISVNVLRMGILRGYAYLAPLIRVQVRTRSRWQYRYCPSSVEAALTLRRAHLATQERAA